MTILLICWVRSPTRSSCRSPGPRAFPSRWRGHCRRSAAARSTDWRARRSPPRTIAISALRKRRRRTTSSAGRVVPHAPIAVSPRHHRPLKPRYAVTVPYPAQWPVARSRASFLAVRRSMGEPTTDGSGHRARLRQRLFDGGGKALLDHELVEYLLALAIPRRDTKPTAKRLLAEFGGLGPLLSAEPKALIGARPQRRRGRPRSRSPRRARCACSKPGSRDGRCCRAGTRSAII